MLSLLEKFEQVEIKEDTRISVADRQVCEIHQKAYEKAREGLRSLAEQLSGLEQEQKDILSSVMKEIWTDQYISSQTDIKSSSIYKNLDGTHKRFVNSIASYFADHYHVSIDIDAIEETLLPHEPGNSRRCGEAEIEEYTRRMRNLTLNYEDILEQIFIQLDGYSFQDKAEKELKDAAHEAAWHRYNGKKKYEQKKAVICFTSYACRFDKWYQAPHISLSDDMKSVIKALEYYEFGASNVHNCGFAQLLGYSFNETVFDFTFEKVKQIKCFKNGRVDIRFTSEAYARQFVEEYLGTEYCN